MNKTPYRISSVGKCPKAISCERLKVKTTESLPAWLFTAAEEGKWHEERIRKELIQRGYIIEHVKVCPKCIETFEEKREGIHTEIELDNCILVGHTDGRVIRMPDGTNTKKILEVKSMSQYEFDRWSRGGFKEFPAYYGQINTYMFADGANESLYIVKNRSSGYKEEFIVQLDLPFTKNLFKTICKIEELAQKGEIYPAEFNIDSIECRRCQYKGLCLPAIPEIKNSDSKTLQIAINSWREGKKLEAEAKELIGVGKSVIEAYTKIQPEKRLLYGGIIAQIVTVAESHVEYDRKAYDFCSISENKKQEKEE